jgi:hypothetical protein
MSYGNSMELYEVVRKAVHHQWDPIGVAVFSEEMGEYDSYIPAIVKLVENGISRDQLFKFLWTMETESMGLEGDRLSTEKFSDWLFQLDK